MKNVDRDIILRGAEIIRHGGLVAFPTETVYGLGADALNAEAAAGIFRAKKRPHFDPLICHIDSLEMLNKIVDHVPPRIKELIDTFWPGPLTLIFPKSNIVPDIITAGLPTVAVRMPNHPAALDLIRESGTPIAAPSANPFGFLSPTTAEHVENGLKNEVDLIIDGGSCKVGVESTIIRVTENKNYLLRPGGLEPESIENIIGPLLTPEQTNIPDAPGLLPSHYSPNAKVILIDEGKEISGNEISLLSYRKKRNSSAIKTNLVLSPSGSLTEAAVNLFAYLHILDNGNPDIIYAERVPEIGLGAAIMNRLKKASF